MVRRESKVVRKMRVRKEIRVRNAFRVTKEIADRKIKIPKIRIGNQFLVINRKIGLE